MQTRLVDIIEMTQRKAMSNCIALQTAVYRPSTISYMGSTSTEPRLGSMHTRRHSAVFRMSESGECLSEPRSSERYNTPSNTAAAVSDLRLSLLNKFQRDISRSFIFHPHV